MRYVPEHIQQLRYAAAAGDDSARKQLSEMGKRGAAKTNLKKTKKKANKEKFEQLQLIGGDWWNK